MKESNGAAGCRVISISIFDIRLIRVPRDLCGSTALSGTNCITCTLLPVVEENDGLPIFFIYF